MQHEAEETWLRRRIIRLRMLLRYAKEPRVIAGLKEFIGEAEDRLDMLEDAQKPKGSPKRKVG